VLRPRLNACVPAALFGMTQFFFHIRDESRLIEDAKASTFPISIPRWPRR
jgi:hypothetical protein